MRLRSKPRSKRVKGSEEDDGRYIKCWNCGFHVDTTKVSTGAGDGISHSRFIENATPVFSGDPKAVKLSLDGYDMVGCMLGSETLDTYEPRKVTVSSGCPFCGCRNLP